MNYIKDLEKCNQMLSKIIKRTRNPAKNRNEIDDNYCDLIDSLNNVINNNPDNNDLNILLDDLNDFVFRALQCDNHDGIAEKDLPINDGTEISHEIQFKGEHVYPLTNKCIRHFAQISKNEYIKPILQATIVTNKRKQAQWKGYKLFNNQERLSYLQMINN